MVKATSPRGGVAEQRRRVGGRQLRPRGLTRVAVFGGPSLRRRLKRRAGALAYEFVRAGARRAPLDPARFAAALLAVGADDPPRQVARARAGRCRDGRSAALAVAPDERDAARGSRGSSSTSWSRPGGRRDPPPAAVLAHLARPRRPRERAGAATRRARRRPPRGGSRS